MYFFQRYGMAACFIKYITNQNLSKTKLKLYLQTKNANMSHRTMNLIEHFARSKDKCILTDSLFTIQSCIPVSQKNSCARTLSFF